MHRVGTGNERGSEGKWLRRGVRRRAMKQFVPVSDIRLAAGQLGKSPHLIWMVILTLGLSTLLLLLLVTSLIS